MVPEDSQLWLMFLGGVISLLSALSVVPNYVILAKLTKTSVKNVTLLCLRSCALTDILRAILFLVFVSPSWFKGGVVYNDVTCLIEGYISIWAQLTLNACLVFLMLHRYSLAHRQCGWTLLRDWSRLCVGFIWITTGIISSLPFAYSLDAFKFSASFSHCVISSTKLLLVFDVISLLIPALLLIIAGVLLHTATFPGHRKASVSSAGSSAAYRRSSGLLRRSVAGERLSSLATHALRSSMTGIETTLSLTSIAYTSSMWILIAFAFRTYGNWSKSESKIVLSASHLFPFASGITRSVIILIVGKMACSNLQIVYATKQNRDRRRACRRDMEESTTSDAKSRSGSFLRGPLGGFTSFSLFMSPVRGGLLVKTNGEMGSFWSDAEYQPSSRSSSVRTSDASMTYNSKRNRSSLGKYLGLRRQYTSVRRHSNQRKKPGSGNYYQAEKGTRHSFDSVERVKRISTRQRWSDSGLHMFDKIMNSSTDTSVSAGTASTLKSPGHKAAHATDLENICELTVLEKDVQEQKTEQTYKKQRQRSARPQSNIRVKRSRSLEYGDDSKRSRESSTKQNDKDLRIKRRHAAQRYFTKPPHLRVNQSASVRLVLTTRDI